MRYYKSIFEEDYLIPEELEYRFLELSNKLKRLGEDSDHDEAFLGYKILFLGEFKKYKVKFKKGDIWEKQTEKWFGNSPIGTKVKITNIKDSFIRYKHTKKKFGIQWTIGSYAYHLNKWSFLRIFRSI
nr:MAG: hypothetical protein [Caudoviricetes sp.]